MEVNGGTRILVVDDNAIVRQQLRKLLELRSGWQVVGEASDGLEAIHKTLELDPDLVLLDFAMPGMNGLQAAQEISQNCPKIPLLLFTMYLSHELVAEARNSGFWGAVAKADLGRDLVPGVEALLRHERFFPEPLAS